MIQDSHEENKSTYGELDVLLKNYEDALNDYDMLINMINNLWDDVIEKYFMSNNNGFLDGLRLDRISGYHKFATFMLNKSSVSKHILEEHENTIKQLNSHLMRFEDSNIYETVYYKQKITNALKNLEKSHYNLIALKYPKDDVKKNEVKLLYDECHI